MADDYSKRIKKIAAQQRKGGSNSYSDRIAKIAAEQSGSASGVNWKAAAGPSTKKKRDQTPVGWVLDMLDRPGNAVRTGILEGLKKNVDDKKHGRNAIDAAGGNPLLAAGFGLNLNAFAGLGKGISGEEHNSSSDVMEKVTDAAGKANDPNYKDVKNNVNPVLKGVGGFVGDVVTDPLTYIPGADLFSIGAKTVKGGRAAYQGVKGLEEGASVTQKIVTGAKAAGKAVTASSKRAAQQAAKELQKATQADTSVAQDLAQRIAESRAPAVSKTAPVETPVAPIPESVNPSDLKPEPITAQEPTALSKQDWLKSQLDDVPDTLKVGKAETTKGDVLRVVSDDAAELTAEEVRNARAWMRRNLNDASYEAYQKTFKNSVSKAAPEAQQVIASVSKADPEKVSQRALRALDDASKNISRGAAKTDLLDFNEIDQSTLLSGRYRKAADGVRKLEAPGLYRLHTAEKGNANGLQPNVARMQNVIADAKVALDNLEQRGAPASVGGTPLRVDEVLQHIGEANPRSLAFLGNGTGRTNLDEVLRSARDAAHSTLSDDELYASLYPRLYKATAKAGGQFEKVAKGQQSLPGYKVSAKEIASDLTRAIVTKRADIAADVAAKTQYWADRRGEQSVNIANAFLENIRKVQDTGTPGQYLEALANIPRDTKAYGKQIGAVAGAADDAAEAVTRQVPNVDLEVARGAEQAVTDATKAVRRVVDVRSTIAKPSAAIEASAMAAKKGSLKQFSAVVDEVEDDIASAVRQGVGEVEDFGPKAARDYIAGLGSALYGGLSKFKADFVAGKYFGLYTGSQSLTHNYLGAVSKGLTKFSKTYPAQVRQDAYKALQSGADEIADPTTMQAAEELRPMLDRLFNLDDPDSLINDSFLRQGANMNEVNRFIRNDGYRLDFDSAMERASVNGTDLLHEVSQQWRYMDVADPVDYVMHMHQAMIDQAGVHNIAQTFMKHAADNALSSKTPKAGYVRIQPEKNSYLGKYLDANTFYDKAALTAFRDVDRLIGDFRNVNKVPKFVKSFDTVQNMWKVGMTSLRPGFHLRNAIGDTALTMLDLGYINPKNFTGAVKVLNAHNTYDGFDALKVLRNAGESELTGKGDKALSLRFRAGRQSITNEDVYRLAKDEGLLADFGHLEGLIDDTGSPVHNVLNNIGSKTGLKHVVKGANAVATFETHHSRLVHFMQLMEKDARKFSNVTQLAEYAARRVKRYHPDPSMLSPFEKKVMRRIIPFYSWQRAIIPLVAESMITRPGRFMMYPKASYNLAVSLGVDPYSISQPFPEDQQFPSFITEQATGPVALVNGKNYSISPGIAQVDVLNDYVGANPVKSVAGSLTPAIKAPIELLTGTNIQTGSPIKSTSDYILGQIPGANYINRAASNATADPQDADPEANKLLVANWLSGLGIQNLNKPSYQRYAQYEQSQKENG